MTKKEKKGLLILVLVVAVVVIFMLVSMNKKGKQGGENSNANNETVNEEEFVQTLDDGTRLNTSTKLQETKTLEGLELSDFQVTAKNNETQLLGTVKNTSSTTQGNFLANVKITDREGNEISSTQVYIKELAPGESTQLITSNNFDYANAYDFTISRVK